MKGLLTTVRNTKSHQRDFYIKHSISMPETSSFPDLRLCCRQLSQKREERGLKVPPPP